MIPGNAWTRYKKVINRVHSNFNQDTLIWVKHRPIVTLFNEQEEPSGDRIELKVLIGFNFFRTWPITKHGDAGELDNQNMLVLINRKYLIDSGYATPQGYFNFRPDKDYFIHRGIKYKAEGDTFLSQALDEPLHIQIILRREETLIGDEMFDYPESVTTIQETDSDTMLFHDSPVTVSI